MIIERRRKKGKKKEKERREGKEIEPVGEKENQSYKEI
jgi:hypothetical protein